MVYKGMFIFIQTSFKVWFPRLTAVTRINNHRTEFAFLYCSSVQGSFAVFEANFILEYSGEDLPSSASACFTELLTFTVNRLLNDVTELEKLSAFVWKEMFRYLKFRIMLKPLFHLYLMFLFKQLDKDDAPMMKMTDKDR